MFLFTANVLQWWLYSVLWLRIFLYFFLLWFARNHVITLIFDLTSYTNCSLLSMVSSLDSLNLTQNWTKTWFNPTSFRWYLFFSRIKLVHLIVGSSLVHLYLSLQSSTFCKYMFQFLKYIFQFLQYIFQFLKYMFQFLKYVFQFHFLNKYLLQFLTYLCSYIHLNVDTGPTFFIYHAIP